MIRLYLSKMLYLTGGGGALRCICVCVCNVMHGSQSSDQTGCKSYQSDE